MGGLASGCQKGISPARCCCRRWDAAACGLLVSGAGRSPEASASDPLTLPHPTPRQGYALKGAPSGVPLAPSFLANVEPLINMPPSAEATWDERNKTIYMFISTFGTHYVNKARSGTGWEALAAPRHKPVLLPVLLPALHLLTA